MGIAEVALISSLALGAGSSIYGGMQQDRAARDQRSRFRRVEGMGEGMMTTGASDYERMLESFLSNSSQDGIMQMFRRSPEGQVNQDVINRLMGISETGDPFDTSEMFAALDPIEERERSEAVNTLRGGATGLGQRFGSAAGGAEADLLAQLTEGAAARRAGIQMQSYEGAQGRRMGALQQLIERISRAEGGGLAADQLRMGGIQSLLGAESGRRGHNLGILQTLMGIPSVVQGQGLAGAGGEISQMAMMLPLMMQLLGIGGDGGSGWTPEVFNSMLAFNNTAGGVL